MQSPFVVHLVQYAHTDIGYTHPQEQIALLYLEYYDQVLALCKQTRNDPIEHRFRWVCETAWQVRHYLTNRPEREAEFAEYVRLGQIELTGNYLNYSDMTDLDILSKGMEWVRSFAERHGLPLTSALHSDVNGWPWGLADVLAQNGIQNFASSVHLDSATDPLGERGSVHYHWLKEWNEGIRRDAPIRVPRAFWWEGPHGGRVLHWLGEHYHLGNVLGLSSDFGFHADKSRRYLETDTKTADDLYATAEVALPRYLDRVREAGYALPGMLIYTSGFWVDNSAPDLRWTEIVRRWNLEHDDVKLTTSTLSDWFGFLRSQDEDLPTFSAAWPDGWAHGLGSMTNRVAQARRTQRRRKSVEALVRASGNPAAATHLDTAAEAERLALEHTFDAWSTTARPRSAMNEYQQAAKEIQFHRAELFLDEAVHSALAGHSAPGGEDQLFVPAGNGPATVRFSALDAKPDPDIHVLQDAGGGTHSFQLDYEDPPTFITSLDLSVDETSAYRLLAGGAKDGLDAHESSQLAPLLRRTASADAAEATELHGKSWHLILDPRSGAITSLFDTESGRDWVGEDATYGFGQLVREFVVHPLGREANGNLGRLVQLGVAGPEMRERLGDDPVYSRQTLDGWTSPRLVRGPVFDALVLEGGTRETGRVRTAWRMYHAVPLVEMVVDWDKPWSDLPEAAYVAFPFKASHLQLDSGGAFFTPGSHDRGGQLPGTVSHYYTTHRAAVIADGEASRNLLWLPLDAPLVMTQEINYSRWETGPYTWNGMLASMPVNHYWHTNFPTSQRGPIRLRYRFITAAPGYEEGAIARALPVEAYGWR